MDVGNLQVVDIAILDRIIRDVVIIFVILEQKHEGSEKRSIHMERRERRRPSELIYLRNRKEATCVASESE